MKVSLANVRLAFTDALFEAKQFQGQGPFNYRTNFIYAPDSKTKKDIDAAIQQVASDKWGKKAEAMLPGILANPQKCCVLDGNTKDYDGYAGNFVVTATRPKDKGRPVTVNRDKTPITAEDGKLYSGAYVNASIEIWAQDNEYGKAIRAQLLGVQFLKDGDAFGGGSPASADDFDDLGEGADDDDFMS